MENKKKELWTSFALRSTNYNRKACFGTVLEEATTYPSSSVVVLRFLAFRLHFVFALGIMMMDRLIALTMQEDTSLFFRMPNANAALSSSV